MKYGLLVLLLTTILEEGQINEEEFKYIRKEISNKYGPVIDWLEVDE